MKDKGGGVDKECDILNKPRHSCILHVHNIEDELIQDSEFAKSIFRFLTTKLVCYTTITVLQVGLLYDNDSLQNVLDMIADWTLEEREMLRNKVTSSLVYI